MRPPTTYCTKEAEGKIMYHMHESLLSGYLGKHKTREWVTQLFYWFGVREDCNLWVEKYDTCASVRSLHKTPELPLDKCPLGHNGQIGKKYPWPSSTDTKGKSLHTAGRRSLHKVGGTLCSARPNSNCMSWVDTEWSNCQVWLPELCTVCKTRTSPGNPRCNGQAEPFNRTLLKMIKPYLKGEQRNWNMHLGGCLAAAYWGTIHESTR